MDFQTLYNVVQELSRVITGARVERVYQGVEGGMYLILHRDRAKFILLLSPDRAMPRLHLVTTKPASSATPHSFVLFLRSHLPGTLVTEVRILNHDRVAEIVFIKHGTGYRIIFELIGAAANVFITNASSEILAVYYPAVVVEHARRFLAPGLPYASLPARSRASSPEVSREQQAKEDVSANKAAEQRYEHLQEQQQTGRLRAELATVLKKNLSKVERRKTALGRDVDSATKADICRQAGDLILANLPRLKRGAENADLIGYDGRTVLVKLDPARSPAENAAAYFKKYKKYKSGIEIIRKRLHDTMAEEHLLQTLQIDLDHAVDREALAYLRSLLATHGYVRRTGEEKRKTGTTPSVQAYRSVTFQGWTILVGKSAAGNDYITMRLARPDDLWLHAEGMPGSHVVVRNPEKKEVPQDVLFNAASLAAWYSKGRGAGKVPVTYTRAGSVMKPKGAKPGTVMLTERKTIMVSPQQEGRQVRREGC